MWQRIQTVWWILSILCVAFFGVQDILLYTLSGEGAPAYVLRSYGLVEIVTGETIKSSFLLLILEGLSLIMSLVSIFIYKMRPFQIRLSILNALVLVGLLGAIAFMGFSYQEEGLSLGIKGWLALPIIALIFQLLATQAVLKDEMLIRMSRRIR